MAPVNLAEVLEVRNRGLSEPELWSVLCSTCETLQDVCLKCGYLEMGKPLPCTVTPFNLYITHAGRVNCDLNQVPSDQIFVPPEGLLADDPDDVDVERFLVFSVGITMETARDFKSKRESISVDLSHLLESMREESPRKRVSLAQLLEHCSVLGKEYVGNLSFSHYLMKLYRNVMGSNTELEQLENNLKSEMTRSWRPSRSHLMTQSLIIDNEIHQADDDFTDFVRSRKRRLGTEDSSQIMSPRSGISGSGLFSEPESAPTDPAVAALHRQLLLSPRTVGEGLSGALDRVQARRRQMGYQTATQSEDGLTTAPASVHSFVHGTFRPSGGSAVLKMGRDGSEAVEIRQVNEPPSYGYHSANEMDHNLANRSRRDVNDLSDFEYAVAYADGAIPDRPDGSVKEDVVVPRQDRSSAAHPKQNRLSQMSFPAANDDRKIFGPEFVAMEGLPPKRINLPDYVPKKGSVMRKEVRVTLLNGERLDISCDPDTLGQSLLDAVLDHMAIPEHYYFGIAYMKDGESFFIEPETKLHKVAPKEWRDAGKNRHGSVINIIFHTYLKTKFYPNCVHRMNHAIPRHLLYLQLRRDLLDERYPLSIEELSVLSGLALQSEFGDHSTTRCGRGYCHAEHYLPASIIRQLGLTATEERLVNEHKANPGLSQSEAEIRFIEQLQQQELYGVHLYKISRDKSDRSGLMYLGVDSVGLKIVELRGSVQTVLLDYPWINIEKISFNKRRFSILPKTDVKIGQKQIAKASYYTSSYRKGRYLLRFCTDQHTFRLRHKTDWESNNAGTDNPSYIHAEDIDDFESEGIARLSSGVRMRKVMPSPGLDEGHMNGSDENFIASGVYPHEDIFIDYSTDDDADRESEAVNSPRRRDRVMAAKTLGDFFELEQASRPHEYFLQDDSLDSIHEVGVSPRKILVNKTTKSKTERGPSLIQGSDKSSTQPGKKEDVVDANFMFSSPKSKQLPDVITNGSKDDSSKSNRTSENLSLSSRSDHNLELEMDFNVYPENSNVNFSHDGAMQGRPSTGSGGIIPPPPAFDGDTRSNGSSHNEAFESPKPRKPRSPRRLPRGDRDEGSNEAAAHNDEQFRSASPEKTNSESGRVMDIILQRGTSSLGLTVTGGVNTSVRDGGIYVKSIISGSCAEKSGNIHVGDRVLSVDKVSVTGMTHRQAVELLRSSGPTIALQIQRDSSVPVHLSNPSITSSLEEQPTVVNSEEILVEKVANEYPLLERQLSFAFMLTVAIPEREEDASPVSLGLHLLDPMPADLALEASEQFVRISRPAESCPESLRRVLNVGDLLLEANCDPLTSTSEVRGHLNECGPSLPLSLLVGRPHKSLCVAEEVADGDIIHCQLDRPGEGELGLTLAGSAEVTGGCYVRSVCPSLTGQGLQPGDKLLAANEIDMTSMSHAEAAEFLISLESPITIKAFRPLNLSSDNDEVDEDEEVQFDILVPSCSPSVTPLSMQLREQTPPEEVDSPPVPMRRRRFLNDSGIGLARPHSYAENLRRNLSFTESDVRPGSLTTRSSDVHFKEVDDGKPVIERGHIRCKSEPMFEDPNSYVSSTKRNGNILQPKTRVMRVTLQKPDLSSSLGFSIVTVDKETLKGVFIKSLVPGGLADKDGRLRVNDRLLQINGESVIGLTNKKVVNLLKKPKSNVTIAISRPFAAIEGGVSSGTEWTRDSSLEGLSARDSIHSSVDKSLSDSSSACHVQKDLRDIFQEYGLNVNSDLDGLVASNIEHSNLNPDLFDASSENATPITTRSQPFVLETDKEEGKEEMTRRSSAASSRVDLDDLLSNNLESVRPVPNKSKLRASSPVLEHEEVEKEDKENCQAEKASPPLHIPRLSPTPDSIPSLSSPSLTHRLLGDHALDHISDQYIEQLPLLHMPNSNHLNDSEQLHELMDELREAMKEDGPGEEYRDLRMTRRREEQECECGQMEVNKPRNRYRNVLPYDSTRVHLRDVAIGDSDYINASHVRMTFGTREVRLIAAQGPVPVSVNHFWQMIVEQGVKIIAMVTQSVENDKVKCHVYWPRSRTEPLDAEKYHIHLEEEIALKSLIVRRFHVVKPSTNRVIQRVFHLNFTAWPDQGIPESATPLLHYLSLLRELHASLPYPGPLLVHCSAGIGRTGALIALLCLINALEADLVFTHGKQELQSDQFNVPSIVRKLRNMRPGMIQTKDQYVFCYVALLELLSSIAQERTALL